MRLLPVTSQPGLWQDAEWQEGTAGTFAVLIGVSHYEHLAGGDAPALDTYGLDQLCVSAVTAFRVFEWLRKDYRYDGAPPAQCWTLTAPTTTERAYVEGLAEHALRPTFQACELAIGHWFATMKRLPRSAARQSRAFFFFSGHGLEISQDKQILLPCDYLAPPQENVNRAMSTQNLALGLASLELPAQFFFLDACRNDHPRLRDMEIQGAPILNVTGSYRTNPGRCAPIVYASGSGTQAWQPAAPRNGLSIFGTSLLEGLSAAGLIDLECDHSLCAVKVNPLVKYVRSRVRQLMASSGSEALQYVPVGGYQADEATVTLVPEKPRRRTRGAQPPGLGTHGWGEPLAAGRASGGIVPGPPVVRLTGPWVPAVIKREEASRIFGSEAMGKVFAGLRLYDLLARTWLDPSAVTFHRVERDDSLRWYRIELEVAGPDEAGATWLEMSAADITVACVLPRPGAPEIRARYVLYLELEVQTERGGRSGPTRLVMLSAGLSFENGAPLDAVARLWQRYQAISPAAAAGNDDMARLQEILRRRLSSPLAATVAAAILLRAGQVQSPAGWLRNLSAWFPSIPDGPVLYAEYLYRTGSPEEDFGAILEEIELLDGRGLPHLGEVLGLAERRVSEILQTRGDFDRRERVQALADRLHSAERLFRGGGLFTVFIGPRERVVPELIAGRGPIPT